MVKLPCTGRVNTLLLLRTIEDGADGVCVVGCREGDCHYLGGNIKARHQVEYTKKMLESLGVEPERVRMYNLSASDGPLFAEYAREFTDIITKLGPIYNKGEVINE